MISRYLLICQIFLLAFVNKAISQNFDATVIKYTTLCELSNDVLTQTDSITLQINNREGDKYTEIEIPFSSDEKISHLEAWIEAADGKKIRKLKKNEIVDKSAISNISMYEDHFKKCFQLKHNVYPYKISYTYKTASKNNMEIAWWTPVIHNSIPTLDAKLKIIIPKGLLYNKYENNISFYRIDSTERNLIFQWNALYDKPVKTEIYSQPEEVNPLVIFTPVYFKYGIKGCAKDWVSYGNWQYRLMEGLDILPIAEKKNVDKLIKGVNDKKEIVKILYHYLQDHTRYINVSIGIGGLKPYPASYVSQNQYGDCKALTNYLKALLSYAGIESYYTKVYAGEQPNVIRKEFVGQQFNHIVLAVPINNDTIWLENTDNTNPFGYMGTFTQNRYALLITKNDSRLVKIPALKKEDNLIVRKLEFDLNTNGYSNVNYKSSLKGEQFESFNQIHSGFNDDEKDRFIREYEFHQNEITDWKIIKLNRDSERIELNVTLSILHLLNPLGNDYYFGYTLIGVPSFTIPSKRTLPVVIPYPLYRIDTLIYNLPNGYEMKTKPDSLEITCQFGNFELFSTIENGKILVIKKFELFSGKYSTEQYHAFYDFIKSIKEVEKRKIVIKPTSL